MAISSDKQSNKAKQAVVVEDATVRFAGDSGDGMQLAGTQLSNTTALSGHDVATFPDYPSEIRAPRGTLAGVSGFQIHFASTDIHTPGESLDCLIAMNPAALKTNVSDLEDGGILIVNRDMFDERGLAKAGYQADPLADGSLDKFQVFDVQMTKLTRAAVEGLGLNAKEADRCRNFFAIGLVYWLYGESLDSTRRFIEMRFGSKPNIAEANRRTLEAGRNYGETTDAFASSFKIEKAQLPAGEYRSITGNQALAWGLIAAAKLSEKELFYSSYPITPASDVLHELSRHKRFGVRTFQAEDEIAAMAATVGAAFAGAMAVTASSGPGIALKAEAMGLGVMLELPMIVISVQRGGPSTGLPTKTEQADLFQVMFGRSGESPLPVLAAGSPTDCFDLAMEAWRIATRFMTPVVLLSDGYIASGAQPWRIVNMDSLPKIPVTHPPVRDDGEPFFPYQRDEMLARPWALPGTKGLEHRLGGLEKKAVTGAVCYEAENHQQMIRMRAQKVANVARVIPKQRVTGPKRGDLLVLGWGGTYGACVTAVQQLQAEGKSVAHADLRYLNPFPANLREVLKRYKKVLIPELNLGQLRMLIRGTFMIDPVGLNKVQGKPFTVTEIVRKAEEFLV